MSDELTELQNKQPTAFDGEPADRWVRLKSIPRWLDSLSKTWVKHHRLHVLIEISVSVLVFICGKDMLGRFYESV